MLRTFAAALLIATPVAADMTMVGDLHLSQPMLRATPPNAPVGAGYVMIENTGDADDTLVAATVDAGLAGQIQLHEMLMNDGVMSMSEVDGGISIPAGETVTLQPGGLHLMVMGLQDRLTQGDAHAVTLTFEQAGDVTVEFPVMDLGEIREAFGAGGHGEYHGEKADDGHSGHGN